MYDEFLMSFSPTLDETALLTAIERIEHENKANYEIYDLLHKKNSDIGTEAIRHAFARSLKLFEIKRPPRWLSVGSTCWDLLTFTKTRPDICQFLAKSGDLVRIVCEAARQQKVQTCMDFFEIAKQEPSQTWREELARPTGFTNAFAAITESATFHSNVPISEFFRATDNDSLWSAALSKTDCLVKIIDVSPYKITTTMEILREATVYPFIRKGIVESGSLHKIHAYADAFSPQLGKCAGFYMQLIPEWEDALFPRHPNARKRKQDRMLAIGR